RRMCCRSPSTRSHRLDWRTSQPRSPMAHLRCGFCFGTSRVMMFPGCGGRWRWPIRYSQGSASAPTGSRQSKPMTRMCSLRPLLRFVEDACVQCGLCQATCPEEVITLKPQIDFRAARAPARALKEEEPFCCIRCSEPFGVRSAIDRVLEKLKGKHWMYSGPSKLLDVIKMCEDCRVAFVAEENFEPYGTPSQTV